ncbi:hypothetical protein HMPREF0083_00492 [Aneurinibacillus aneurinilyticus ATCC 12856]|uniref:Uncharacterized protein n=1 Tax=Aneurinibacillus aneurinilyticus ATCC 12856 TaxID=649747 RepID=U1WS26_ANEAE|nr:hypothetical protein HMPREF0083_00492 [Aneurinibacillus aneurinilyticus ATCC 12856]
MEPCNILCNDILKGMDYALDMEGQWDAPILKVVQSRNELRTLSHSRIPLVLASLSLQGWESQLSITFRL